MSTTNPVYANPVKNEENVNVETSSKLLIVARILAILILFITVGNIAINSFAIEQAKHDDSHSELWFGVIMILINLALMGFAIYFAVAVFKNSTRWQNLLARVHGHATTFVSHPQAVAAAQSVKASDNVAQYAPPPQTQYPYQVQQQSVAARPLFSPLAPSGTPASVV